MTLQRVDEVLADQNWPELGHVLPRLRERDVLVTCAGFEDRALAFLERAVKTGNTAFRIVGISYLPEVAENRMSELHRLADQARSAVNVVNYDRQEPGSSSEIIRLISGGRRVFIDVSGMSRLLIVQLVAAAVRHELLDRMTLVYSEAKEYPPVRAEVEASLSENRDYFRILNFISSGVLGVSVVPELSTVAMQGQPVRLIAFPSFNPAQFAAVCAEIQASSYCIINGVPPSAANQWRRDAIRMLNNIDSIHDKEEFDTSTLDYRETLKLLLSLYKRHGAVEKLVISPTGSKMQSVAVGLTCGFLRDVQVIYPAPRSFQQPTNYTRGVVKMYALNLHSFSTVHACPNEEVFEEAV